LPARLKNPYAIDTRLFGLDRCDAALASRDADRHLAQEAGEGSMSDATVAQFPSKMSELDVEALVRAIKGEKAESLIDSGAALVTKENMGQFN
jgi:ABC-type sugar transport system substrate-binding protein